jgi:branched-chain amino acid aminotransferase
MTRDATADLLFANGELCATAESQTFERIDGGSIYEVLKVIEGIPLFFEDHMCRMRRSAALIGVDLGKTDAAIDTEIRTLVFRNRRSDINAKLVWFRDDDGRPVFLTYFVKQDFPDPSGYSRGVHTILYSGERENP